MTPHLKESYDSIHVNYQLVFNTTACRRNQQPSASEYRELYQCVCDFGEIFTIKKIEENNQEFKEDLKILVTLLQKMLNFMNMHKNISESNQVFWDKAIRYGKKFCSVLLDLNSKDPQKFDFNEEALEAIKNLQIELNSYLSTKAILTTVMKTLPLEETPKKTSHVVEGNTTFRELSIWLSAVKSAHVSSESKIPRDPRLKAALCRLKEASILSGESVSGQSILESKSLAVPGSIIAPFEVPSISDNTKKKKNLVSEPEPESCNSPIKILIEELCPGDEVRQKRAAGDLARLNRQNPRVQQNIAESGGVEALSRLLLGSSSESVKFLALSALANQSYHPASLQKIKTNEEILKVLNGFLDSGNWVVKKNAEKISGNINGALKKECHYAGRQSLTFKQDSVVSYDRNDVRSKKIAKFGIA